MISKRTVSLILILIAAAISLFVADRFLVPNMKKCDSGYFSCYENKNLCQKFNCTKCFVSQPINGEFCFDYAPQTIYDRIFLDFVFGGFVMCVIGLTIFLIFICIAIVEHYRATKANADNADQPLMSSVDQPLTSSVEYTS